MFSYDLENTKNHKWLIYEVGSEADNKTPDNYSADMTQEGGVIGQFFGNVRIEERMAKRVVAMLNYFGNTPTEIIELLDPVGKEADPQQTFELPDEGLISPALSSTLDNIETIEVRQANEKGMLGCLKTPVIWRAKVGTLGWIKRRIPTLSFRVCSTQRYSFELSYKNKNYNSGSLHPYVHFVERTWFRTMADTKTHVKDTKILFLLVFILGLILSYALYGYAVLIVKIMFFACLGVVTNLCVSPDWDWIGYTVSSPDNRARKFVVSHRKPKANESVHKKHYGKILRKWEKWGIYYRWLRLYPRWFKHRGSSHLWYGTAVRIMWLLWPIPLFYFFPLPTTTWALFLFFADMLHLIRDKMY